MKTYQKHNELSTMAISGKTCNKKKSSISQSLGSPLARPHRLSLFSNGSLQCRHFGAHWRRKASLHSCREKHGMAPVSQGCQQNLPTNYNNLIYVHLSAIFLNNLPCNLRGQLYFEAFPYISCLVSSPPLIWPL